MYFSKNSRYVYQTVQWLSHSPQIFQPLIGNDRTLSVKFPKDDPTKPPLRVNIPKDGPKPEDSLTKLFHDADVRRTNFPEPRSKSLITRSRRSNIGTNFESDLFHKSESEIQLSQFVKDETLSRDTALGTDEVYQTNPFQSEIDTTTGKDEHEYIQGFLSPYQDKTFNETAEEIFLNASTGCQKDLSSSKPIKEEIPLRDEDNSDIRTLYIIIDVPEKQEEKSDLTDKKIPPLFEEDFAGIKKASSKIEKVKAPKLKVNWQKSDTISDSAFRGKSKSLSKLTSYKSDGSKTTAKFEVHEIEDAATYVFHLRLNRNLRDAPIAVRCVPEGDIISRSHPDLSGLHDRPYAASVRSYKTVPKTVYFAEDTPELIKYPEWQIAKPKQKNFDNKPKKSNTVKNEVQQKADTEVNVPPVSPLAEILNTPESPAAAVPQQAEQLEDFFSIPQTPTPSRQELFWNAEDTTEPAPTQQSEPAAPKPQEAPTPKVDSYNTKVDAEPEYYNYFETINYRPPNPTGNSDPQCVHNVNRKPSDTSKPSRKSHKSEKKAKKHTKSSESCPDLTSNKSGVKFGSMEAFKPSASVINIACEPLTTNSMKFSAAFPPILSEALKRRSRSIGLRREALFHDKWMSKPETRSKDFEMSPKCVESTVNGYSENSILFPRKESESFDYDAVFASPNKNDILCVAKKTREESPKISDNIANVANSSLTEVKGSPSLDTLTMMKKVKEIIDLDLNNAIKIFNGNGGSESEKLSSVVVLQGNDWEVNTKELENCVELQRTQTTNEINIANTRPVCDDGNKTLFPKYLPTKKENETMMKLESVHSDSVVTFNPSERKFQVDATDLDNITRIRHDETFNDVFNNKSDPVAILDNTSDAQMEMKSGDSILVFDEESQSWKVDYSILEKREQRMREEEELTKRSEFILETFEKLEKEQMSNIPKPLSRDKRIFDYSTEEWKAYNPDKRSSSMKQRIKSKSPFKESDAEEIRKKNSDLYDNLFVSKKKETKVRQDDKDVSHTNPGTKSCNSQSNKRVLASDKTPKDSDKTPTKPEQVPVKPEQPKEPEKRNPAPDDGNFWGSFLQMDILPKPISELPKIKVPPPPADVPKDLPKTEPPKIEVPKTKVPGKKIEEPKFKIPYPFKGEKKIDESKKKTPPKVKPKPESSKTKPTAPEPEKKEEPKTKTPVSEPPAKKEEPKLKKEEPKVKVPPSEPPIKKEEPTLKVPSTGPAVKKEEPKLKVPYFGPTLKKEEPKMKTPWNTPSKKKEEPKLKNPPPPAPSKPKEEPKVKAPPPGPPQTKDDPKVNPPSSVGSSKGTKLSPSPSSSSKLADGQLNVVQDPGTKSPSVDKTSYDHYISDNIVEISRNSKDTNSKTKPNKVETVKLNITSDKRMPSKITEINLNKKCEEKIRESNLDGQKKPDNAKKPLQKNEKTTTENKTFYKNFEKYKTPYSDPEFGEKPIKINSDMESNPNLKKLDNWNKTLVLHDTGKPPENIESWLKDETDKMATLLLKVLQDAADGKPRKKPTPIKSKSCEKLTGKPNPYDNIRKKQETTPEAFLFKVRSVNIALDPNKKSKSADDVFKSESPVKEIPVQSAKTVKPSKVVDAVKITPSTDKEPTTDPKAKTCKVHLETILEEPKLKPEMGTDSIDPGLSIRELLHQNKMGSDLTEDIPGPTILKKLSSAWKMFPVIGCQMTIATLFRLFQLVNMGTSFLTTSNPDKSRRHAFTKLFNKYGPIVNVQGPLSGNVILIHKPEHLTAVFEQDSVVPVRSVFDSLEQSRRETEEKMLTTGISTDWSKPEWNNLKRASVDPLVKGCEKFFVVLESAAESLVNTIRKNRNGQSHVSEDFMEEIKRWSLEGLCNVLFERSFGFLERRTPSLTWTLEPDKLYHAVDEATQCITKCEKGFQAWRLLTTPSSAGLGEAYRSLSGIISKQLYQAEINLKNKNEMIKDIGLVPALDLTFLESMLLNDGMTTEDITCNLVDIIVVGSNALSSALGFLLYNLAHNVKVQNKLLTEIKSVLPEKSSRLDYHKLHSLKYLQACLKESLRLNMPIPLFFRVLQNDILISNYIVPKGTYVVMDQRVTCMKEQIFDRPEKFMPERWLNDEKWMENIHPFFSFPLCHGPRAELAKRIVEMQLWACIAKVVRNFEIDYHYGEIQGTDNVISFPDKPLKLNFNERDS